MPPKKNPRDILKKLKHQKKVPIDVDEKPKSKRPKILTEKNRRDVLKEEEIDRKFFSFILELKTTEEILLEKHRFVQAKGMYYRKNLINDIFKSLPENVVVYHNFAEEYIFQTHSNLHNFWESYKQRPEITKIIHEKIEEIEERERLQKINEELFDSSGEDEEEEMFEDAVEDVVEEKKEKRSIKIIDDFNEEIVEMPTIKDNPIVDRKIISKYKKTPWLGKKTRNIYISPVDDTNLSKYINPTKSILKNDDIIWYPVSPDFYYLVTGPKSMAREQKGDIMKAFESNNNPILMKVGFEIDNSLVIQDEKILTDEKNYHREANKTLMEKINDLLSTPVTEELLILARMQVSKELHHIAPDIRDYGTASDYDTLYIKEVVQSIYSRAPIVEGFLTILGKLVVYLREEKAEIFKERLRENYYLPSVLTELSPDEKFPEAFSDPISLLGIENAETISKLVKKYVLDMNKYYFYLLNPTLRKFDPEPQIFLEIKVSEWKEKCINKEEVKDIPDYKVIYYQDPVSLEVHCLQIDNIIEQLDSNDTVVNTFNNKALNEDFLKRFRMLYYNDRSVPEEDYIIEETITPIKKSDLAPGLLEIIRRKINECKQEIADNNLNKDGKCQALQYDNDNESVSSDSDSESNSLSPKYTKIDNICYYCGNDILDNNSRINTIKKFDNNFEEVSFCDVNCCENVIFRK